MWHMGVAKKGPIARGLWVLVSAAMVLIAVALVISIGILASARFMDLSGAQMDVPVSVQIDAQALHVGAPSLGIPSARLRSVRGSLVFPPRRSDVLGVLAGLVVMLATALWVLAQLRALLGSLGDGRPFVPANVVRVRRIGIAVIAGALGGSFVNFVSGSFSRHFNGTGLTFEPEPNLNVFAIVCGLLIVMIAEVFRAGIELEEEQSLTV
jgi:hypothetical protein